METIVPAGFLMIIGGASALAAQVGLYFYSGQWTSWSAINVLSLIEYLIDPVKLPWLRSPSSWIGMHEILLASPASAFLVLLGICIMAVGFITHHLAGRIR